MTSLVQSTSSVSRLELPFKYWYRVSDSSLSLTLPIDLPASVISHLLLLLNCASTPSTTLDPSVVSDKERIEVIGASTATLSAGMACSRAFCACHFCLWGKIINSLAALAETWTSSWVYGRFFTIFTSCFRNYKLCQHREPSAIVAYWQIA